LIACLPEVRNTVIPIGIRSAVALVLGAATAAALYAQTPEQSAAPVVERAGQYVDAYEKTFSGMVCEERQIQKLVRSDGRVRKVRELKSDLLLVTLGDGRMPVFRDVLEVDGKAVRNREDRLRKLFLEQSRTAVEQAQLIAEESARHNIGLGRFGISPFRPLRVLLPDIASGFRFTWSGRTLGFEEFRSPSFFRNTIGSKQWDLMSRGSFVVEAVTGRVLSVELTAAGPPPTRTAKLAVDYREHAELQLLVPVRMREEYWRPDEPKEDRTEAESSYSNFRRFQVLTEEAVKIPK